MITKSEIKRPMISKILILLLVSLVPSAAISQQRASAVDIDKVILEPLLQTMPVIGRFVAKESGVVATRIAERVEKMQVQVGDRVKKGDVLVKLASDRLDSQILILKAEKLFGLTEYVAPVIFSLAKYQTHLY